MISLPKHNLDRMGASKGSHLLVTQPFSQTMILELLAFGESQTGVHQTRELGYIIGMVDGVRELGIFGVEAITDTRLCNCCGRFPAAHRLLRPELCLFCCKEVSHAVSLRQQPSQTELKLKQSQIIGGASAVDTGAAHYTGPGEVSSVAE